MVQGLHGVEGGASFPGLGARVCAFPVKSKIDGHRGTAGIEIGPVLCVRMPDKGGVQAVEHPVPNHIVFGTATLFGGTAEEFHRPRMSLFQPFRNGDGRRKTARSQQVMSATVPISVLHHRLAVRNRGL